MRLNRLVKQIMMIIGLLLLCGTMVFAGEVAGRFNNEASPMYQEECYGPNGHEFSPVEQVPATCGAWGINKYKCYRCGETKEEQGDRPTGNHVAYSNPYDTKNPTCTTDGYRKYACSVCGQHARTSTIAAPGHTEVIDKAVEATCTTAGKTKGKHCSVCNTVLKKQETVPAKGHTRVTVIVNPTCTTDGYREYACSVCGQHVRFSTIAAPGHTEVIDKAVEATCTAAGKTKGKHCSVCYTVLKKQETVPAKGHTEVTDKAVAATCTAAGKTEGKHCSACDTVLVAQEPVPAKGHTEVADEAVAATCTAAGKTEGKHCSACDTVLVAQEPIPAKGHTEVADEAVAATCTVAGKTEGKHCSACDTVLVAQEPVPAKGHTEVADEAVAATCTVAGKTEGKHCSACDTVLVAQEPIPAKGHTEATDEAVAATCTVAGKTEGKHCTACDTVLEAQQAVPALGHTYDTNYRVCEQPTCTEAGSECRFCTRKDCSDSTDLRIIPALGHERKWDIVPATGTTDGYELEHCVNCEKLFGTRAIPGENEEGNGTKGESKVVIEEQENGSRIIRIYLNSKETEQLCMVLQWASKAMDLVELLKNSPYLSAMASYIDVDLRGEYTMLARCARYGNGVILTISENTAGRSSLWFEAQN